ncbi:HlyD family secretion protein [Pedobacter cryoconitis]|uniref:HlyD family secretion protein n=1 Tax=Pedobacter cryoconitis TaxID=188932 RepID=A0A7X0JA20_9SPHI|nr:HlyD family efflux transporter periplasmic adaptor subunit [Pedobacter cryoconitis]MBB6503032.1 HlyD family secretion protein [Pedobacter cryoconitis]
MPFENQNSLDRHHSEEIQDIISKPPAWLIRWGLTVVFTVIGVIISMSAFIKYPDVITASLKVNSLNSPKPVISKISAKLIKIFVKDNVSVSRDQSLAFLESTADHMQVLNLLTQLKNLQSKLRINKIMPLDYDPQNTILGELQANYESFNQSYLTYQSSISNGFYLKKRSYLERDLLIIENQKGQLENQLQLQKTDYEISKNEYDMHSKLYEKKVEAQSEFQKERSKLIAKKYPLQQTEGALLSNSIDYFTKKKEILELDNTISDDKLKFTQALNSLISAIEDWKKKYILSSPETGRVVFLKTVQENQFINVNDEVLYINPGNTDFYGDMSIPQYKIGKVRKGQKVLIKLKSYPFEEYGVLYGRIESITNVPYRDSVFVSKVSLDLKDRSWLRSNIHLKNGMTADAEIITEDATLLKRLVRNFTKMINH